MPTSCARAAAAVTARPGSGRRSALPRMCAKAMSRPKLRPSSTASSSTRTLLPSMRVPPSNAAPSSGGLVLRLDAERPAAHAAARGTAPQFRPRSKNLGPPGRIEESMQADDEISRSNAKGVMLIVGAWSLAMIWFAVTSGPQHEYVLYLSQWNLVLSGADPWSTSNAYGPLHNLLAYLLPLGQLGPKLLIVGALIAANAMLVQEIVKSGGTTADYGIYLLAVPTNFLVIVIAFAYGLNDALVAAFAVFAILARFRDKLIVSGCLLGAAILLKYYPIFLVPLFALDHGRIRFPLVAA